MRGATRRVPGDRRPDIRGQLADLRRQLGNLRQRHLAWLVGVHPHTVSDWEQCLRAPTAYQYWLLVAFGRAAQAGFNFQYHDNGFFGAVSDDDFRADRIPHQLSRVLAAAFEAEAEGGAHG